jgi:uncharacterized protein (TIGR01777 family)
VRILVAGGSGFLGQALVQRLRRGGHDVGILTRRARPGAADHIVWTPDGTAGEWHRAVDGADAIVNLAGEGIADARWTNARKQALRESRILSTRSLVSAMRAATTRPHVFVSASGIGYYGDRGAALVTEDTPAGADFLATLCVEWEREAQAASDLTRVAMLRSGLVLHASGGALGRMLLPFRLGIGGRLGSGAQYLPWIHRDDWTHMVEWMLQTSSVEGAMNVTAPQPVTNAEFTRTLGRALRRPTVLPVPAAALRLVFGELADTLLTGQRAIPQRGERLGFRFQYANIDDALQQLLR